MARNLYNNQKQLPIALPDFGKVPPQSTDMEEAVLGAVLNDPEAVFMAMEILQPESFYREANKKIFEAIITLNKKNFPIDTLTVTEELRATQNLEVVGGPMYLFQLTSKVMSAANIEYHARIVAQKYIQRELIRISSEIQVKAFDDRHDIADLMDYAETSLMELSGAIIKKKPKKFGQIIDNVITTIGKIISGEIKMIGVPSGFPSLDHATGGFKKQELTIIACRPSVGKTALALQIAINAAEAGNPVGIFSCEMSEDELGRRGISNKSGRSNTELINGRCSIDQLIQTTESLSKLPIFIDDTSGISLVELKAKVRRLIIESGIKLVIIDYLQLMKGEGDTREQEVSSISRGLKAIAKNLNISVIALSQLNRGLESRSDKKPTLSDLRESGAIEQDADMVLFPYRPEMQGQLTVVINGREENAKGIMQVILAKNRNGIACIEMTFKHNESMTHIYEEDYFKANVPPEFDNYKRVEEPLF